jgi:hypothetical protein
MGRHEEPGIGVLVDQAEAFRQEADRRLQIVRQPQ